jgi:hypothetical protein
MEPKRYREPVEVTFTFPPSAAQDVGYASVTVRELTPSMEARALARSNNDGAVMMQEMVKECLVRGVRLDGSVLLASIADNSADQLLSELGPKGRTLLLAAYNKVNQPPKEDLDGFLQSASASVG